MSEAEYSLGGYEESLNWKDREQEVTLSKDVFSANKATMTLAQFAECAPSHHHAWCMARFAFTLCQSAEYGLEFLFSMWLLPHKPGVVLM